MGPISKHNQEGQHQVTLGTLYPVSLRRAFRIHNLDIEEKSKNRRVDGDFKFVWSQLGSNNGWVELNGGSIEKIARRRFKKDGDYMKVNRISIIEPWAAVTSGGRVTVLLSRVACIAGGVILLLSLFSPTQHPALFTDALVQLCGSAFPQICSLSSLCHLKDSETTFRQSFFFFFLLKIPLWPAISRVLVSMDGQKVVWLPPPPQVKDFPGVIS